MLWRHEEFYPSHSYVHLDIGRNFFIRKVRFFVPVVENEFNQVIFGEEFAKKDFQRVSDDDKSIRLEDNEIEVEIPSLAKPSCREPVCVRKMRSKNTMVIGNLSNY